MSHEDLLLAPGTLWPALLERTDHARRCGAIHTIPTLSEEITQEGMTFLVRIMGTLAKKAEARAAQQDVNPFLPYDPDLFVADISPTHLALLNKFNVVDHHLLIVTRTFEEQTSLLTLHDFAALLACLREIDGLGFYNAGATAGASQRHKHLQLVSLPLTQAGPRLPLEPLLRRATMREGMGTIAELPFLHACASLEKDRTRWPTHSAETVHQCYRTMLQLVGLLDQATQESGPSVGPYNLLVTRDWMFLVPRSVECYQGISINALGFAGALLVRDQQQLDLLKAHGPMTALRNVGVPNPG